VNHGRTVKHGAKKENNTMSRMSRLPSLLLMLVLVCTGFTWSAAPVLASSTAAPASIIPTHLAIPSIGVDAPVEQVGLTADKAVESPSQWMDAAWYKLGYQPGALGNAAIIGHLDSTTGPAVFWRVGQLKPGAAVVLDDGNTTLTFLVQSVGTCPADNCPMQQIYGPANAPRLNLITCTGDWNPQAGSYTERLVVYTVLQGYQNTASAGNCQFVLGFQALYDLMADVVGDCSDNETHNPVNGDALQHTTGGLLVWRKADNWTAFTDGFHTWVNGPNGLQERLNTERFSWEANPDGLPQPS
jgi:sortase (surface protein transpeptidase)